MNDILAGLAPTIASAILGPLGGVAVAALGKIFGIEEATTAQVSKVFQDGRLTPEQLSAIKALEMQYQNDEKERGFRYAELEFKNQDSARQMQIAVKSSTPAVLTYLLTCGFFGVLTAMFMYPEVKESAPLMIMLGSLGTAWSGACAFWFGTTSNSAQKTALIAQANPIK